MRNNRTALPERPSILIISPRISAKEITDELPKRTSTNILTINPTSNFPSQPDAIILDQACWQVLAPGKAEKHQLMERLRRFLGSGGFLISFGWIFDDDAVEGASSLPSAFMELINGQGTLTEYDPEFPVPVKFTPLGSRITFLSGQLKIHHIEWRAIFSKGVQTHWHFQLSKGSDEKQLHVKIGENLFPCTAIASERKGDRPLAIDILYGSGRIIILPKIHLSLPKLAVALTDYAAGNTPRLRRPGINEEILIFKNGHVTFFNEPLLLPALPMGILKAFAKRPGQQVDSIKMMIRVRGTDVGDIADIFKQHLGTIRRQFSELAAKLPPPRQQRAKTIAKQIILSEGQGKYRLNLQPCDIQWH